MPRAGSASAGSASGSALVGAAALVLALAAPVGAQGPTVEVVVDRVLADRHVPARREDRRRGGKARRFRVARRLRGILGVPVRAVVGGVVGSAATDGSTLGTVVNDRAIGRDFPLDSAPLRAGQTYRINDYDLASRLSFFVWGSMPDAALLKAAMPMIGWKGAAASRTSTHARSWRG